MRRCALSEPKWAVVPGINPVRHGHGQSGSCKGLLPPATVSATVAAGARQKGGRKSVAEAGLEHEIMGPPWERGVVCRREDRVKLARVWPGGGGQAIGGKGTGLVTSERQTTTRRNVGRNLLAQGKVNEVCSQGLVPKA